MCSPSGDSREYFFYWRDGLVANDCLTAGTAVRIANTRRGFTCCEKRSPRARRTLENDRCIPLDRAINGLNFLETEVFREPRERGKNETTDENYSRRITGLTNRGKHALQPFRRILSTFPLW